MRVVPIMSRIATRGMHTNKNIVPARRFQTARDAFPRQRHFHQRPDVSKVRGINENEKEEVGAAISRKLNGRYRNYNVKSNARGASRFLGDNRLSRII